MSRTHLLLFCLLFLSIHPIASSKPKIRINKELVSFYNSLTRVIYNDDAVIVGVDEEVNLVEFNLKSRVTKKTTRPENHCPDILTSYVEAEYKSFFCFHNKDGNAILN